jgi:hypothetical protein
LILRVYEARGPIDDDESALARRTGLTAQRIDAALTQNGTQTVAISSTAPGNFGLKNAAGPNGN